MLLPANEYGRQSMLWIILWNTISTALENGGAPEGAEIWRLHAEHIRKVAENGGKGRGFKRTTYHPLLLNWAIAFLARTSANVYNEVAKVMMLPSISHVHKKTVELISTDKDKAFTLHMNNIQRLSDRARENNWTGHQRIGVIAQGPPPQSTLWDRYFEFETGHVSRIRNHARGCCESGECRI